MEVNKMDACKHIYFYTPGQILAAYAGILSAAAGTLAALILL
jgi:hypothetical protein